MSNEIDDMLVDASPTKEFFIYMLTRDIEIRPAILEFIDNSVDGAKRIRPDDKEIDNKKDKAVINAKPKYEGLTINIELSKDEFIIEDNCGGFDIDTARKYAFKFGRAPGKDGDNNEEGYFTGIFGIGMKRALFKLGRDFQIVSTTATEHFEINVKVDEWINNPEWNFEFTEAKRGLDNKDTGTRIVVKQLNSEISTKFDNDFFINSLIDHIQKYRTVEAENGLKIVVNGTTVDYGRETLVSSKDIQPYQYVIDDEQGKVTIMAGITKKGAPQKAGWYIYCNGRVVLYADKTDLTGWGDGVRAYHPGLAEFRGYVYFESKDLLTLPWNTTKTGVDTSNRLYMLAKEKMIDGMSQVIKTIDHTKKNHDVTDLFTLDFIAKGEETTLTHSTIHNVKKNKDFTITEPKKIEPTIQISFRKPKKEVDKVKENMDEAVNKAVGEKLFDYYYEMEGL